MKLYDAKSDGSIERKKTPEAREKLEFGIKRAREGLTEVRKKVNDDNMAFLCIIMRKNDKGIEAEVLGKTDPSFASTLLEVLQDVGKSQTKGLEKMERLGFTEFMKQAMKGD